MPTASEQSSKPFSPIVNVIRRRQPQEDPEVVWRRLIRLRCEGHLMVFGVWPRHGSAFLVSDWPPYERLAEPEEFGPWLPTR